MIVMDRIGRILQEAGGSYYNLASVNGYQRDMDDWPAMNETYEKFFPDGKYPERTVAPALLISGGEPFKIKMKEPALISNIGGRE